MSKEALKEYIDTLLKTWMENTDKKSDKAWKKLLKDVK